MQRPSRRGMAAALHHCDALVSDGSLEALQEVIDAIAACRGDDAGTAASWRPPALVPEPGDEPWGSTAPVTGSAGDADRLQPQTRQRLATVDAAVTDEPTRLCIYPGCLRRAVPPHPLGGPQPAFCDLEEHNALSAHQERQRRAAAPANQETDDVE